VTKIEEEEAEEKEKGFILRFELKKKNFFWNFWN